MGPIEIIAGALLMLVCVLIVITVTLQSNKGSGMSGVIMGGEGTSVRGKAKSNDAKLAKITKILAVVLFVLMLVVTVLSMATK